MAVIEKRVAGKLREIKPLASKLTRQKLVDIFEDVFQLGWEEPFPPAPFKYTAGNGLTLNVRPELRGVNFYWFANKQHNGRKHHIYLAPVGLLEKDLLDNAAIKIAG